LKRDVFDEFRTSMRDTDNLDKRLDTVNSELIDLFYDLKNEIVKTNSK